MPYGRRPVGALFLIVVGIFFGVIWLLKTTGLLAKKVRRFPFVDDSKKNRAQSF